MFNPLYLLLRVLLGTAEDLPWKTSKALMQSYLGMDFFVLLGYLLNYLRNLSLSVKAVTSGAWTSFYTCSVLLACYPFTSSLDICHPVCSDPSVDHGFHLYSHGHGYRNQNQLCPFYPAAPLYHYSLSWRDISLQVPDAVVIPPLPTELM